MVKFQKGEQPVFTEHPTVSQDRRSSATPASTMSHDGIIEHASKCAAYCKESRRKMVR